MAGAVGGFVDAVHGGEGILVKTDFLIGVRLHDGGEGLRGLGLGLGLNALVGHLIDHAQDARRDGADQKQHKGELENLVHWAASFFAAFLAAFSAAMSSRETPNWWRWQALSSAQVQRFMIKMA